MSLKSVIEFSVKLLKLLNSTEKSTIYSPSLILNSLAMIFAGSNGITAEEIVEIIGKGKDRDEIIEYYSNFFHHCKTLDDGFTLKEPFTPTKQVLYQLLLSNRLFVSNKSKVSSEWEKIMEEKFDSQFESVNFDEKGETVNKINKFVALKTEYQINKIIQENDIDDETVLFIISALTFKGYWKKPFDDPIPRNFYSNNNSVRKIDMITHDAHMEGWNLTEGENWQCLGIPFKTDQSWLHILLPHKNEDFAGIVEKLDFLFIQQCVTKQPVGKVIATIPTFQIESDFNFEKILKEMGLKNAFCDHYGIRGMLEEENVVISKTIHKASIKVDKFGTFGYACGVLGFKAQAFQQPKFFIADHPFVFFVTLIDDKKQQNLKNILLMGTFC